MAEIGKKLQVLKAVARQFNRHRVTWAVGGSLLLYFKGITDDFHDIDLFILQRDVPLVRRILEGMGSLQASMDSPQYQTRTFLEYDIDGVELDVMAGFAIVDGVVTYDCSLELPQIRERILLEGETIPLMDLRLWATYYKRMHRPDKAERILQFLGK